LDGIVAKRKDHPYRSGGSPDWIKNLDAADHQMVKQRHEPAPPMTLGNGRLFYQFNQLVGHVANSNGDGGDG
jgi:hypothetical protein